MSVIGRIRDFLIDQLYAGYWHARSFFRPGNPARFTPGDGRLPTIVPIAGVFERWDFLIPLLDRLNALGYPIHPILSLGRNQGRVPDLAEYVLTELEVKGIKRVVFLGHSKGGLIAKGAMLLAESDVLTHKASRGGAVMEQSPVSVLGVIAIATPFRGSTLANLVQRDPELASFRPSSRATVTLRKHDELDHRIVSIFSEIDQIIADPGYVPRGVNVVVEGHGHFALLSRGVTGRLVESAAAKFSGVDPSFWEPAVRDAAGPVSKESVVRVPKGAAPHGESLALGIARSLSTLDRQQGRAWASDYVSAARLQLRGLTGSGISTVGWSRGDPDKPPVVLLPGVLEPWSFLYEIGQRLHSLGFAVHFVPGLGYNRSEIGEAAVIVNEFLELRDLDDVLLVAHSKGGLIGKYLMATPVAGPRIRHLIAIATPFAGSLYAKLFLDRTIRAFAPDNRRIRSLSREITVNARITSIYGEFDPHIPATSELVGAAKNIRLPISGHFRILHDELLIRSVCDEALAVAGARAGGMDARPGVETQGA